MALEPDKVKMDALALDAPAIVASMRKHPDNYQHAEKIVDNEFVVARYSQRNEVRVGVMGDPAKASPKLGQKIVEDIVQNALRHITALEASADGVYKEISFIPEPLILK
jgi:creatinine amidohydrolase/Fe(II)-dependent formamide hydrolase-like protein